MKDFSVLEHSVQRKPVAPSVIRESISWTSVDDGTVEVSLDVMNLESTPSDELDLIVEAAPFGAFVPGSPVARIAVGALDPGESRTVTVQLDRDILQARGLNHNLSESARASGAAAVLDPLRHSQWIGNLNVYFDRDRENAVERHRAFDLRIPAGTVVSAAFIIKDTSPCELTVECSSVDWVAVVQKIPATPPVLPDRQISGARFRAFRSQFRRISVTTPNRIGDRANVTVYVRRLHDDRVVPVEFEFKTVDGWGQSLGCVKVNA